jgi:uncharacterized protein YebE (UPF0316 family)
MYVIHARITIIFDIQVEFIPAKATALMVIDLIVLIGLVIYVKLITVRLAQTLISALNVVAASSITYQIVEICALMDALTDIIQIQLLNQFVNHAA